ncbi:MATE family efflux transporter [Acetobacterium sp.]|jgi:putative MATE family efflux protein|uniref:MATE family efflux transporter n=1 Tax=Acetobacterium sp. TaxID=1872094 RepID=UPI000CC9224B|nr:MATE family efflux transporter [Acetobacterium sp.]MDO9493317.1 MATE family efflux transporter [Acetobacterium sp.]PKM71202.1 MAG: MATE family efflux transporter [Firmicutes bacterium HGW-Firmicutes-17]
MKDTQTEKKNKLGVVPIPKLLFSMSIPAIISMMIQAMYNIVDSIFVAQIGEEALTAVSLAFPIQMVIISCFVGMGIGINSAISRRLGQSKKSEAANVAEHGFILAILIAVVLGILGFFTAEAFISLFTDNANIIAQGRVYLMIVTVFCFGSFITQAAYSTLQGSGEMIQPMVGQIIGAVTNIILDPIMIFGWLGFPAMGVAGAAIATVIGQIFGMTYMLLVIFKSSKNYLKLDYQVFHYDPKIIKDIFKVGLPAAIMQGLASLMITGYNLILAGFGMSAVAVFGVYFKIQSVIFMPIFGLGQGAMPIFGFNYGAKNRERYNETLKVAVTAALTIMTIGTLLFWIFPAQIMMAFNPSAEMMEIGINCLRSISLAFPLAGVSIMIGVSFQAIGKAYVSMIASFIRQMVVLLPVTYLLAQAGGLDWVWYGFIISEVVCMAYQLFMFRWYQRRIFDTWEASPVVVQN